MSTRPAGIEDIIQICNGLLRHHPSSFPREDVMDIFRDSGIIIDGETGLIAGTGLGVTELWNGFFELLALKRGLVRLAVMEAEIKSVCGQYGLLLPRIFSSSLYEMGLKCAEIEKERNALLETLHSIEKEYQISDRKMFKDPLSQVYKEDMFVQNLVSDISVFRATGINFSFFVIEIDGLTELNFRFGRDAGDELLANASYLLRNFKKSNREYAHHLIFKMNGPRFTYYCNDVPRDELVALADDVRSAFRESKLFITDITVSIGLVHSDEFAGFDADPGALASEILNAANSRLRTAKHGGRDSVCSGSAEGEGFDNRAYILVADPDSGVRAVLESHLGRAGFRVTVCVSGDEVLKIIDMHKPDVVISDAMLPRMDGFTLRKKMLEDSGLKDIPFVLTSIIKDEKAIIRAHSLGLFHFLKKPYSITEMAGLVRNLSDAGS